MSDGLSVARIVSSCRSPVMSTSAPDHFGWSRAHWSHTRDQPMDARGHHRKGGPERTHWPASARPATSRSRTDHELVVDGGDARRGPRRAFGVLTLRPGAHGAAKRDLPALRLHLDSVGIGLGRAPERVLDVL